MAETDFALAQKTKAQMARSAGQLVAFGGKNSYFTYG
jgi:hypothetical protein